MYSPTHRSTEVVAPAEYAAFSRIRWGAVFAGTLIALTVMVALNLLGVGIGLTTIDPATETNPLAGLGTGAIIWYVVASLLSLFTGGYVAGKLSGFPKKSNAGMHGLLSWGLFTIVSLYLFTTAMGRVVSGVGSAISSVTSGVTNTVGAIVPDDAGQMISEELNLNNLTFSDIRREAFEILEDMDKAALDPQNLRQDANQVANRAEANAADAATSPYAVSNEVNGIIDRIQSKGGNVMEAADRDALINVLVARTDMGEAEARRAVNGWSDRIENAAQQVDQRVERFADRAAEVGGDVADGLGTAAILGFVGLLLGALAAFFGGTTGRQADLTLTNGQSVNAGEVS